MLDWFARRFQKRDAKKRLGKKRLQAIEEIVGRRPNDYDIYVQALTHRSQLDGGEFAVSNERLEYLGDAALGLIVAERLFHRYPRTMEGDLTKMRSNLVNGENLFRVAKRIDLFSLLFIHDDLISSGRIGFRSILADAMEALIGAVYLDCGADAARDFVVKRIVEPSLAAGVHLDDRNYKSQLLEYLQSINCDSPRYRVVKEDGPEHERLFTVEAVVDGKRLGEGTGRNKKTAEQRAAKSALKSLIELEKRGDAIDDLDEAEIGVAGDE